MVLKFLESPSEFYSCLKEFVEGARTRVSLATLYVGDGEREMKLLKTIDGLPSEVEVNFLVDGLRGNRKGPSNPIQFIKQHCPRAHVQEYVTCHYSGMSRMLPDRIREIVGTQHMKIVAVDDTVMITGANLSDIYFTNRQDRYLVITNTPELAQSLHDVVKGGPGMRKGAYTIDDGATKIKFATHHENQQDEVLLSFLRESGADSTIHLCSPYLNLSPEIFHALKKFAHVKIITGSVESNGFHKSKGLSGLIPDAYEIIKHGVGRQFELYEYARPGWTFHPKGIWITPANSTKPTATVIGSSNFSHRSLVRDVEISFSIMSDNAAVRTDMKRELDRILRYVRRPERVRDTKSILRYLVKGPLKTFL